MQLTDESAKPNKTVLSTRTSLDIKLKATLFSALLKLKQFKSESAFINHIDEEDRSAKNILIKKRYYRKISIKSEVWCLHTEVRLYFFLYYVQ